MPDTIIDHISYYYFTDWIGMALIFSGVFSLGNQKRYGFIFGLLSNISWFAFGILSASIATILANVILFILNLRGYIKWNHK